MNDDAHLDGLGERFYRALDLARDRDLDGAADLLSGILKIEPRLGEPHLELARILAETGQLDEAEAHAREAVRILESGGQWVDDLPEPVLQSLAHGLLGEVLRRRADSDEVVFGDPKSWESLMKEAKAAFARASELDPTNTGAQAWSREL